MNTTDKPKCTAADGKTEVHNLPGVGLVVSAAAFNALVRDAEELMRFLKIVRGKHGAGILTLPPADLERFDAAMQEKQS